MKSLLVIVSLLLPTFNLSAVESGWNILKKKWDQDHWLDFASIEWDYFMIHNTDGKFYGAVGMVYQSP